MLVIFKIIVLSLLYCGSGWLGLSLAILPGYATVFWPAAGVALAFVYFYGYRVLPGVFLGSFLLNFTSGYAAAVDGGLLPLFLSAFFIALGALSQAAFGAYLVRRFVGDMTRLERPLDIVKFAVFAGCAACFISASVGVFALWGAHVVGPNDVLFMWVTWYLGDVLGVLVVAPVLVLLLNRDGISMRRKFSVGFPLALIFMTIIGLFFAVKAADEGAARHNFIQDSKLVQRELLAEFDKYILELNALRSLYDSSSFVDRDEFAVFAGNALKGKPEIQAFWWVPSVARDDVSAFRTLAVEDGVKGFEIRQKNDLGFFVPAEDREAYFPVYYSAPFSQNSKMLGYDLGADPDLLEIIHRARDSNKVIATQFTDFKLTGQGEADVAPVEFLIFQPVYDKEADISSWIDRKRGVVGLVAGVFDYSHVIERIIEPWQRKGLELRMVVRVKDGVRAMYDTHKQSTEDIGGVFKTSLAYHFAGRDLIFEFSKNPEYVLRNVDWSLWYMLCGSLVFSFLASLFLLAVTGQSAQMEILVAQKTKELSTKNKFLNIIMDNVPDLIFVKNDKFEIVQANQTMLDKYPPEEREHVVGTTGLELYPAAEQDVYLENDRLALRDGYSETEENNTDYTGYTRTLYTKKVRFYDEEANPFILGVARDMTDFLATQKKLEAIFDSTAEGLITIRENGIIETYNKACETIFGYTAKETVGRNITMLMPEEYARDHGSYMHAYMSGEDAKVIGKTRALEAKRKNGQFFPIELSVAEVKLGGRRIFSGVIRDITEKKQAEEMAQQIAQIFNNSLVEFYIFDADTFEFLLVNEGALKNIGYAQDELLGLKPSDIKPEYDEESFKALVMPLLSGKQDYLEFDTKHARKDGSHYDVLVNLQKTIFQGRAAFIAVILDVTERRKIIHELQRSNKELENFAYVTSHDLKAPLRHVSMSAGFFKEKFEDKMDEQSKDLLQVMMDGTDRMQNMIESLLAYSRVGRGDMELAKLNLNDVVSAVRQNLAAEIRGQKATIKAKSLPFVKADRFLMIQLIQNLVQNALKYRKDDVVPKIHIDMEKHGTMVHVMVSDNGIGIDPAYGDKIFEIFQRLHRDNEYEGVGIGLSICQRIVEFHGGEIWLDKDYTDGSRFVFSVPGDV